MPVALAEQHAPVVLFDKVNLSFDDKVILSPLHEVRYEVPAQGDIALPLAYGLIVIVPKKSPILLVKHSQLPIYVIG